jgi:hypothetical protein
LADTAVAATSVTSQPSYAPVLWTDATNLTVGGSTVTKTSGCDGCPDAFAVSGPQTGSQDAYLEFPAVLDKRIVVGFIPIGEGVSLGAIDYGVGFYPDGGWDVREGDGYRIDGSTGQGDIFRIALEGTQVTYYRNGLAIWTAARRDGISYRAVVLDYSSGGTLDGADLAINSAPVISAPGAPHFALSTLGSMAIGAVDPEHDIMTFSAFGLPTGLSLNPYSGIIAGTPTTAGASAVSVTVADLHGGTTTTSFTLTVDDTAPPTTPTLTSVSPSSAAKGAQVTLTGTNFGTQANGGYVWLGTVPGSIVSWSATQIVAGVDPDAATGVAQVRLPTGNSNTVSLAVVDPPSCTYTLSPTSVTSPAEGTSGTIAISTPSNCAWTASSPGAWVTLSALSGVGPATITYTIAANAGIGRSATLTIGNASLLVSQSAAQPAAPPALSTVSPDSGVAGTQVTLSGSNFGAVQNGGSVWLGTRQASIVNWSDTSITATVASGSTTGTAQVRRIDVASNALPFGVITPIISGVTPSSGAVGTAITISGTGFGATQGASSVWLGSRPLMPTSWSDTQIAGTIPSGATPGGLQVLRGGVLSNSATFTVTGTAPRIDGIWPTSGGPGTTVFILGQGFGATQGVGSVLLGGAEAPVTTWSDSSVQVTVANTALSGPLKLQQNGLWSNAKSFVIASASGAQLMLSPSVFNLVVGESRSIQALDGSGADVPGLTWTSSNPGVVTVSTDPSPQIMAVAPGAATIRAGDALAEVTVFAAGGMPEGTVLWSVPGPTSGVSDIAVAVPAPAAVADVFAIGLEGEVQAITADGNVAWTVPGPFGFGAGARPDFQGGLVVFKRDRMARLDPLTGQTTTLYANANAETLSNGLATPAIHPDGKVLTVDYTCHDLCDGQNADDSAAVVGIDLSSGNRAFRVPLANSTFTTTNVDSAFCGNAYGDGTHTQLQHSWPNNRLTIAADGFAYLSYLTYHSTGTRQGATQQPYPAAAYQLFEQMRSYSSARDWSNALATLDALLAAINEPNNSVAVLLRGDYTSGDYGLAFSHENAWAPQFQRACNTTTTLVTRMHLMRVSGEGQSSDAVVREWTATDEVVYTLNPNTGTYTSVETHTGPSDIDISEHVITNGDHGALYSWRATEQCSASGTFGTRTFIQVDACQAPANHLTVFGDTGTISSDVAWNLANQSSAIEPSIQLEDGSFGASQENQDGVSTVVFDALGHVKFTLPGVSPLASRRGGGLFVTGGGGGISYGADANGSAIAPVTRPEAQSWLGTVYRQGSVEGMYSTALTLGLSHAPFAFGTLSSGTDSYAQPNIRMDVYCRAVGGNPTVEFVGALHCYIVTKDASGAVFTIEGYERNFEPDGTLRVAVKPGTNYPPNNPSNDSSSYSAADPNVARDIECLKNTANTLDLMQLPYHFLGPNSNSTVVELLRVCGRRSVLLPPKAFGRDVRLGPIR